MLKKIFVTMSMILLLTITVLSCSDDSNPTDPVALFLTLTYPVGGEILMPDSTEMISWDDNIDEGIRIDLYKNSLFNMTIADSIKSIGNFEWTIPDSIEEGLDYKIKIISVDDSTLFDESENNFKITSVSSVTITEPNGSEIWNIGGQRTIKWNFNSKGFVKIDLLKNSLFYETIKDSANNSGSYDWFISIDLPQDNDYQIKITNVTDSSITDTSDDFFSTGIPIVYIYDTSDIITNSEYKVQWYGNSNDSTNLNYFYCITTDTTMINIQAETALIGLWNTTQNNYANVSFPMEKLNSTELFIDSTTYIDTVEAIEVTRKVVFSKFFVYAIDDFGAVSEVKSKVFGRMNKRPEFPVVRSDKFDLISQSSREMIYDEVMVLPSEQPYWSEIDFKWISEDPDGYEAKLEYRWELWNEGVQVTNSYGWSNIQTKSFSSEIYNYNATGTYMFRIFVRDDALEEALDFTEITFRVFAPTFEKGILFIDDTDPSLYPPSDNISMGNPDSDITRAFYELMMRYSGYKPEGEATDSLSLYRIKRFVKGGEFVGWEYYEYDHDGDPLTPNILDSTSVYRASYAPNVNEMSKYRMVIIASDDRSNFNGVDFIGELPYTGYNEYLSNYLDVGGKVMILGNSVLMGNFYASPNQLPINEYEVPFTQVFDPDAPEEARLSDGTLEFFRDYFGIYSMTFPEQKTYITMNVDGSIYPAQFAPDKGVGADNYDFIGVTTYDHIDTTEFKELRIDSTRVKEAWWDKALNATIYQKLSLKDNGTVFTGIPTFEAFKGEIIYNYKSIYDLPFEVGSDTTTVDGDITHSLLWEDNLTGETHPVLRRSGSVATRYISDGDIYRTAFFGLPTYFLDNSENQVSDMFKNMIDWFDLEIDPTINWKKK